MGWLVWLILLSNLIEVDLQDNGMIYDELIAAIPPGQSIEDTLILIRNHFPGSWLKREYFISPKCHIANFRYLNKISKDSMDEAHLKLPSNGMPLIFNRWLQAFGINNKIHKFWTQENQAQAFGTNEKSARDRESSAKSAHRNVTECYKQKTGERYWGLTRISNAEKLDSSANSYKFSDTGKCVNVYVVDSGVNVNHKTFGGRATVGYVVQELYDSEGARDILGHGTHIAGLAAGSTHGSAKHANVIVVKAISYDNNVQVGKLSWLLEGLEWIARYINETESENIMSVINLSLGIEDPERELYFLDECLKGIPAVIVAAAGNNDTDACKWFPARSSSVITVAATGKNDSLFYPSNFGQCVDILAPGQDILSAVPYDNESEFSLSGTLMAAPLVSGVVAQHLENLGMQISVNEMKRILQDSATRLNTSTWDSRTTNLLLHSSCDSETPLVNMSALSDTGICFLTINFTDPFRQRKKRPENPQEPKFPSDYIDILLIVGAALTCPLVLLVLVIKIYYRKKHKKPSQDERNLQLDNV